MSVNVFCAALLSPAVVAYVTVYFVSPFSVQVGSLHFTPVDVICFVDE